MIRKMDCDFLNHLWSFSRTEEACFAESFNRRGFINGKKKVKIITKTVTHITLLWAVIEDI